MTTDMTPERFARIRAVYLAAARLTGAEQDAYLSGACAGDPALEAEVRELLALGEPDDASVEALVAGVARELKDDIEEDVALEAVGPYRILKVLGRGGMGRVWLAERADGHFEQKVAVKLVDRNRATSELVSRFRSERQILARLDHPNIARLFDGGETDDGVPYLVMEYVDGVPVDQYCDEERLSIRARLRLFLEICEAVEYAHRNLVVHRDIKASNILVTADGKPKLLDFGIAKLIDDERARSLNLHLTADVANVLTPATASPEQLDGRPVTTATDVYALGHLLYRLLTGAMPYDVDETDRFSLPRAILDEDPVRPSAAAIGHPEAEARDTSTEQLSRGLAGDLDAIVLKALRKAPTDRYAAPRELAEDVERYLGNRPVQARGEAFGYITRRFISRHRGTLAAATSVVVLIATLVAFYTFQLAEERDRARTEARRAEEALTFMTNLFEVSTPGESLGAEITAREMLDRGAERVGTELASEPTVQVSLMHAIGTAYTFLGLYDEGIEILETALAKREEFGIPEDADLGATLHSLGTAHLIEARYDEATPLLERSLEVRRRVHGELHSNVVATQIVLYSMDFEKADFEKAKARLDEAEAVARAIEAESPQALADVLIARGDLHTDLGEYDSAIEAYRSAVEIHDVVSGRDHPRTLQATFGLAKALRSAGRWGEAEVILRELVDARRRVLPEGHPDVAHALGSLSNALKYQGRPQEALPLQQEALAILRAAHREEDQPDVSTALNNLGNILHDLRDLDGALELLEESMEMTRRLYGDNHPELATAYNNIAGIHADKNDFASALAMYERTLEIDIVSLGEDHPYVHQDRLGIGVMQGLLGRTKEAEANLRQSLEGTRRVSGDEHPQTFNAMRELGILLQREGRCDEAMPILAEALPGLEASFSGDPWEVAMARAHLGACEAASDPVTGEARMREAYERLLALRGADDRMTRSARELLAEHLRSTGRSADAM